MLLALQTVMLLEERCNFIHIKCFTWLEMYLIPKRIKAIFYVFTANYCHFEASNHVSECGCDTLAQRFLPSSVKLPQLKSWKCSWQLVHKGRLVPVWIGKNWKLDHLWNSFCGCHPISLAQWKLILVTDSRVCLNYNDLGLDTWWVDRWVPRVTRGK